MRPSSPLTPWGDGDLVEIPKKRKTSLKSINRQSKSSKDNGKKKDKKDNGKPLLLNGKSRKGSWGRDDGKPETKFRFHTDIHEYMREYRQLRSLVTAQQRNCNCNGIYGMAEIEKAYEDLGLPRLLYRAQMLASRRTTQPEIPDETLNPPTTPEDEDAESESSGEDSDTEEYAGLPSSEARERRNNLNLCPLRKQVRLPDMTKYPVQTVSGMGVQELVRLATARGESGRLETRAGTTSLKMWYSSPEKKHFCPSLHLQEKTLCRVVELSLPSSFPSSSEEEEKKVLRSSKSHDATQTSPNNMKHKTHGPVKDETSKKNSSRLERLSDVAISNDDSLTITFGTSRSYQSSVLSNAVSSLSHTSSCSTCNQKQTVREMLTAAVRDLQPFSKNGRLEESKKEVAESDLQSNQFVEKSKDKQVVSLQAYRNMGYKASLRKYVQELYTPVEETPITAEDSCLIAGKPLRRARILPEPLPPNFENRPEINSAENKSSLSHDHQQSICAAKLLKRVRQRQIAAETYKSIKRVVELQNTRSKKEPKLAIFSKCQTVVKPQVSVRGVAL